MEGKIIILNGASSSGKSTLAYQLKKHLDDDFFYLCIDDFNIGINKFITELIPFVFENIESFTEKQVFIHKPLIDLFHNTIKLISSLGKNVIVDHIITSDEVFQDLVEVLQNRDPIFIGLVCNIEELERREVARGDRPLGLARTQFELVHKYCLYDIEVDTSNKDPELIAQEILKSFFEK